MTIEAGRLAVAQLKREGVDVVTAVNAESPDLKRGLARVPDRQPLAVYGTPPAP